MYFSTWSPVFCWPDHTTSKLIKYFIWVKMFFLKGNFVLLSILTSDTSPFTWTLRNPGFAKINEIVVNFDGDRWDGIPNLFQPPPLPPPPDFLYGCHEVTLLKSVRVHYGKTSVQEVHQYSGHSFLLFFFSEELGFCLLQLLKYTNIFQFMTMNIVQRQTCCDMSIANSN